MARILEVEVMNDPASVDAYTAVTSTGGLGIKISTKLAGSVESLQIADIGCGNCGYYSYLNTLYPNSFFTAYDASSLMLEKAAKTTGLHRIKLVNSYIPDSTLPNNNFDLVISSLLLHQLPDHSALWQTIKQIGKTGAKFVVFDLLRVEDSNEAWAVVNETTEQAPDVFKKDFFNSLRAAFTLEEIQQQLLEAGLVATIETQEIYPNCSVIYITGTL